MSRRCNVLSCTATTRNPGVTFHRIPGDNETRTKWLKACKITPEVQRSAKLLHVCSRHFLTSDFKDNIGTKYMLRNGVVPSIFNWTPASQFLKTNSSRHEVGADKLIGDTVNTAPNTDLKTTIDATPSPAGTPKVTASTSRTRSVAAKKTKATPNPPAFNSTSNDKNRPDQKIVDFTIDLEVEVTHPNFGWVEGKIKEVDSADKEVLVEFDKSAPSKQEWIPMDSNRIRLCRKDIEVAPKSSPKNVKVLATPKTDSKVVKSIESKNIGKLPSVVTQPPVEWNASKDFVQGERVMATWRNNMKFLAVIKDVVDSNNYVVRFDDGIEITLGPSKILKMSQNAVQKSPAPPPLDAPIKSHPSPLFAPAEGSKQDRRDRKRKLVVTELFGKRPKSSDSPKSPKIVSDKTDEETSPTDATLENADVNTTADQSMEVDETNLTNTLNTTKITSPIGSPMHPTTDFINAVTSPTPQKPELALLQLSCLESPEKKDASSKKANDFGLPWVCRWVDGSPVGIPGTVDGFPSFIVDDPFVPPGWKKHVFRHLLDRGTWCVAIESPDGKFHQGMKQLREYLEVTKSNVSPKLFDFKLHIKKARLMGFCENNQSPRRSTNAAPKLITPQIKEKPQIKSPVARSVEKRTPNNLADSTPEPAIKIIYENNVYKCPIDNCLKQFRREHLAQMHIKHYHKEFAKLIGSAPNVSDLAYARFGNNGENEFYEDIPRGALSNFRFSNSSVASPVETSKSPAIVDSPATPHVLLKQLTETNYPNRLGKSDGIKSPVIESKVEPVKPPEEDLTNETFKSIEKRDSTLNVRPDKVKQQQKARDIKRDKLKEKQKEVTFFGEDLLGLPPKKVEPLKIGLGGIKTLMPIVRGKEKKPEKIMAVGTSGSDVNPTNPNPANNFDQFFAKAQGKKTFPTETTSVYKQSISKLHRSRNSHMRSRKISKRSRPRQSGWTESRKPMKYDYYDDAGFVENNLPVQHDQPPNLPSLPLVRKKNRFNPGLVANEQRPNAPNQSISTYQTIFNQQPEMKARSLIPLTPTKPKHYVTDTGEVIKLESMKKEEIINCICGITEEDGLMIQCELCLCWQHAYCSNIEREEQVPEKYICYICLNPLRARPSKKYVHDQDWLKQGTLATGSYHTRDRMLSSRFEHLRRTHELSGNLRELLPVLHSLKVKLKIAENKDHPKFYLWSRPWDKLDVDHNIERSLDLRNKRFDSTFGDDEKAHDILSRELKTTNSNVFMNFEDSLLTSTVNKAAGNIKDETESNQIEEVASKETENKHLDEVKYPPNEKPEDIKSENDQITLKSDDGYKIGEEIKSESELPKTDSANSENLNDSQTINSDLLTSPTAAINLLTPSDIEKIQKTIDSSRETFMDTANFIPEPEAKIEPGACRDNLIDHIRHYISLSNQRMDAIEKQVEALENQSFDFYGDSTMLDGKGQTDRRFKETLTMLQHDLVLFKKMAAIS